MKQTPLKRKTGLKAKKPMNRISRKQALRERYLAKMKKYLTIYRAHHRCEICGNEINWLAQHHIIKRSLKRDDTVSNLIIACQPDCHNHIKFPDSGLPISVEAALRLIEHKNMIYNITQEKADEFINSSVKSDMS